jgi:4-amino-4-deoxy-L-arabinose transferase-like glycosyltransferase
MLNFSFMFRRKRHFWLALVPILIISALLRGNGIGQGLPGLYDPDEPLFFINSLELLVKQTFQPGWFGHPGATTLYLLAFTDLAVFLGGKAAGMWDSTAEFATLLYVDPSPIVLPARIAIAGLAVVVIAVTARLGARLGDPLAGLVAALLIAVSPLHTEISGLVRTDIMVSLFTLLAMLAAVRVAEVGVGCRRVRDMAVAGLWMGTAVATKWPGAVLALAPLAAWGWAHRDHRRRWPAGGLLLVMTMLAAMALLMPPLWLRPLDVWDALKSEVQPAHVGATGGDWLYNLGWYADVLWMRGLGWAALLVPAGLVLLLAQRRWPALLILALPLAALLVLLSSQANVWQRWLVLPMPLLALLAGFAVSASARAMWQARSHWLIAGAALALAVPLAATAWAEGTARSNPTQARAVNFALRTIPPGSRITVEMLAFPLLKGAWSIRYSFGKVGCVDGRQFLAGKVNYDDASSAQKGKQKLVLGTTNPARISSCWADYAIIHDADRWLAEAENYPAEAAMYRAFINGGATVGEFSAISGVSAGPRTLVIKLRPEVPVVRPASMAPAPRR